ncbi:hypothetical protein DSO57_1001734 [Entomophthora muscae]|uniref:Uncharacterized protein n=1 Tax=Entomophthora muscae TaxID=34485 RepID=A0ACC2SM36_9FUNG|nr:hypothetical protein DSO57_1001734 [Entomophthora muscae]
MEYSYRSNLFLARVQLAPLAPDRRTYHRLPSLAQVLREIYQPHQYKGIQKRPRRKYHEVRRIYACEHPGCEKAYGALNHLNSHILSQNHGRRKRACDFNFHK